MTLRSRVVEISQDYLGPAAERFIDRQIRTHLKKAPDQLNTKDLKQLIDWIKLAFALLTHETNVVDEYMERLVTLTKKPIAGRR